MEAIRVGIDIAKSVFHVHAVDRDGRTVWQKKLKRDGWVDAVCALISPSTLIGMEACAAAHHWGREFAKRGYRACLVAGQFVKPYVKSNKNDRIDAAAICEAIGRPGMRFVAVKTVDQQDTQAMHRIRSELVAQRTAKANQIRGLVGEYGIVAPIGIDQLRLAIPMWLDDFENGLTAPFRALLEGMRGDMVRLDERIHELDQQIALQVKSDPAARLLATLRGVGPLTASALAVALGDGKAFRKGRDFAASLGLTPRQYSTGGREKLLGISKRGDAYLRTLLIHGARTTMIHARSRNDALSRWVNALVTRKHVNVAIVALANKTARMAWALLRDGSKYEPTLAAGRPA